MNPWLSLRLLGLERLTGRVGVDTQVYLSMIFQIAWVEVVKIYFDLTKNVYGDGVFLLNHIGAEAADDNTHKIQCII